MWLARYFPGLAISLEQLDELTPERTAMLRREGRRLLRFEEQERELFYRLLIATAGGRMR